MDSHYYAIVWIDHREAKVFHFNAVDIDRLVIHPHNPTQHLHHKAKRMENGSASLDQEFFERVAMAIADAKAILITGPADAKSELVAHITRHHPHLVRRIEGVETIDHPSDGALVGVARICFKGEDRMQLRI
jgi:stalled ribosome rescue protein Dom34